MSSSPPWNATSSGREYSTNNMTRFGLMDSFDVTVFKEDIENHKPAPDVYLSPPSAWASTPPSASPSRTPQRRARRRRRGMHVVMVPDYNEPTDEIRELCAEVLPSLTELPAALDRLM